MKRWGLGVGLGFLMMTGVAQAQPAPAAADASLTELEKLAKTYPFRGSSIAWWQSLSALTLNPGAELTYNPTYNWTFRFAPRYNLNDKFSIRLKMDLSVELTNSDDTTKQRETQLGDTWLDFVYASFKEPVTGISFTGGWRFLLPTSKQSQARSLYMGLSPSVAATRSFQLGSVELELMYSFRYTKMLNKYTTLQYDAPTIGSCAQGTGDCGQFLHTGGRNASHDFWNIFSVDFGWTKKLRTNIMVAFYNALLYDLTPASAPLAGGQSVSVGTNGNNTRQRAAVWYYIDFSYQVHPTLNLGVGVSTFNSQLADDSTYRAPFFNRFTEIMFNTTVSLDALVALFDRRKTTK